MKNAIVIKSRNFWIGAILLAIIPLLAFDLPKLYVDWKHDVRDERMFIGQNTYSYSGQQKASILDEIAQADHHFKTQLLFKGGLSVLLFAMAVYFLWRYFKTTRGNLLKPAAICIVLVIITGGLKVYSWVSFGGSSDIRLLKLSSADTSLKAIYNENFKGKVLYVDFWGTTCPPCLEEFRNFTGPLKTHYRDNPDIAYLYIASGTRLIWKQQLQKFRLTGSHIFLNKKAYADLYHNAVRGAKDTFVVMPRYVIMDKNGAIVDKDAPGPSEKDSVEVRLDKYLIIK